VSKARRKYKNPPIVEALCEFRFEPREAWNLTVPGLVFQALREVYDGQPKERRTFEAGIKLEGPDISVRHAVAAVQVPDKNNTKLLSIGPDVLSIHVMRPYPNWEGFKPLIESGLKAYAEVTKPAGIRRIGVRYINRLEYPIPALGPEALVESYPAVHEPAEQELHGFISRVEMTYKNRPFRLVRTFASARAEKEDHGSLLLDLDAIGTWEGQVLSVEQSMPVVDELRDVERAAFEAFITDKARELFDA
jgi:uncharacterized protein (TIGR04255 family)